MTNRKSSWRRKRFCFKMTSISTSVPYAWKTSMRSKVEINSNRVKVAKSKRFGNLTSILPFCAATPSTSCVYKNGAIRITKKTVIWKTKLRLAHFVDTSKIPNSSAIAMIVVSPITFLKGSFKRGAIRSINN